ncbi:MAG: antibiotic biosynthesis monooxygenase [Candidatus Eremiobacteraeota bacterium]|nr:antibiotic biosynthesis monooxygenase [Candidatus Eremiobacteraeota bacterium]
MLAAMVIQSVHFTFAEKDSEKAEELLRELRMASLTEDGVMSFDVARGDEQPNAFALWEEYKDRAAMESHMATEHFQRLVVRGVRAMALQREAIVVVPL